uniref:Uncharacterized protein n=1 Tax=Anguilla anguilla TaxID=7936 RepID=A0A0E9PM16_ANGAN
MRSEGTEMNVFFLQGTLKSDELLVLCIGTGHAAPCVPLYAISGYPLNLCRS